MKKELEDLIKMSERKDANIPLLIESAYERGVLAGIEIAKENIKEKIIEVIKEGI